MTDVQDGIRLGKGMEQDDDRTAPIRIPSRFLPTSTSPPALAGHHRAGPVAPQPMAPPVASQPQMPPRNGFGIAALCLGLVGLVFMTVPLTGFIAVILGGLALIFGLLGWARARRGQASNTKTAITGTVLGAVGLVVGVIGIVIVFQAAAQFSSDMDRLTGSSSAAGIPVPYAGASAAPERPAPTGYTYEVTGNYRASMIGYTASNGDSLMVNNNGTTSSGAKLPWSMTVTPEPNGNVQSLNASTMSSKGDSWITCTIKDDAGAVVETTTGRGAYAGCYASTPLSFN